VAPLLSDRVASIRTHQELLNPVLLLRDVAADPSIATAGEDSIEIAHGPTPITLWLDPDSGQVARATTDESTPLRRDVELEVAYGDWTESAAGVSFPGAVTITYDGVVVHDETRTVDTDAPIDAAVFAIPIDLDLAADPELATRGDVNHQHLQSFAAVGFPLDGRQPNVQAVELAPGLFHLTGGSHHSMAVIQDEGVVIVDAPLDETRSAAILGWLATVAPDLPVTHVVQSHHHVDHSGGLRWLAGTTGAQVVVGEPAAAFYQEESFASPSEVVADGIDGASIDVVGVAAEPLVLGADSATPVTVYPFPNPHAEDMVLIEAGGALWVVDIYTPGLGAGSPPEALVDFVTEQGIEVTQLVGGHGATDAWADVVGS
jgi:glyoxylase-like metal-dependent hydrolase (beta-lactamase superfamily II)